MSEDTKSNPLLVEFKLTITDTDFSRQSLETLSHVRPTLVIVYPFRIIIMNKVPVIISIEKKAITSTLKYLPQVDQQFFRAMLLVV